MSDFHFAVVVPAYEPDNVFPDFVKSLTQTLDVPVIIIDDGSDPKIYGQIFSSAAAYSGVVLLHHEKNYGKGRALKTAFKYCLENQIDGVVTADSDGQHLPFDIRQCLEALKSEPDSLILGVRDFRKENVPFKSRFGNRITCKVFHFLTGHYLSDTQTGLRGISARFMRHLLNIPGERFEFESIMLIEAARENIPYKEVKISTVYENGNSGTHFHPLKDSWMIYKAMFGSMIKQFLFFIISAILSFGVDVGLFSLCYYWIFFDLHVPKLFLSVIIARVCSSVLNYLLNRNLVFRYSAKECCDFNSFGKYCSLCLLIMLCSYGLTAFGTVNFPDGNIAVIKITADILLFIVSFMVQRFFIFKS